MYEHVDCKKGCRDMQYDPIYVGSEGYEYVEYGCMCGMVRKI
jgi:hypothetical protein